MPFGQKEYKCLFLNDDGDDDVLGGVKTGVEKALGEGGRGDH